MNYQGETLDSTNFNETITGLKRSYKCWSSAGKLARKYMTNGHDLVCLASESMLIDNQPVRKYIYIDYHKTIEDFFITFKDDSDLYYYFIPVAKSDNPSEIVEDIKAAKHPHSTI